MSYRRTFHKTISVPYSGTVSYPASQSGGTVSYNGTAREDVQVNINVETTPFDRSVASCNSSVNSLTGAVVATEAAQLVSIDSNARKIGSTIVEGFFKTIRSEISQQIAELSSRLEATLIHLREMAKRCVEKQTQMESDYNGIAIRYIKVFDELNSELSNRIFELDKPAFMFKKQSDSSNSRASETDLVSTVTVFGAEGGDLQARISASVAKKRALEAINRANVYLWKQKKTENTITKSMLNENLSACRFAPVCFVEMQNENSRIEKSVYQAGFLPEMQPDGLADSFQSQNWGSVSQGARDSIQRYFNSEVSLAYASAGTHAARVRENIIKMLNFNQIESV